MTEIVTLTLNPTIDRSAKVGHVIAEKKLRCTGVRLDPGGGGINVGRAIVQLGGEAKSYWTGGGPTADLLTELLDEHQMEHCRIKTEGPTRENVIVDETDTNQQFRFGMPGPFMTKREQQRCLDEIATLDPVPKYLVLSGSLPLGVEDDFYGRIIDVVPAEVRVVLDTGGTALEKGVHQSAFLLKPNQRELGQLAGKEITSDPQARDAAKQLIDKGEVKVVLVSLGRGGILLVSSELTERIAAPTVPIQSKIGAGDSTVAGTVLALQRGESLLDAARFGVACGTAAVMTEGTELCRREDAERLWHQMQDEMVS